LFSTDNLKPLIIGGLASGAAVITEEGVKDFFLGTSRFDRVVAAGDVMGNGMFLGPAFGAMLLTSRFSRNARFRNLSYSLAQGYVMNNLVIRPIKVLADRERPNGRNSRSFPSLHTNHAFMWATVIASNYDFKVAVPAYLAASYVGFSRLAENEHHLTDVVAGATLGYLVGRTVSRRMRPGAKNRVTWMVVPLEKGFAFSVQWKPH
jgi:membrane-associated phospholipid phosphatase